MAEKRYWLMKSEPNAYSFTDLMNEDDSTAEWDGVPQLSGTQHHAR